MYKTLAAVGVAAALLFTVPQGASALPGQGTDVNNSADIVKVGYKNHRYYKHRKWRRGHGHHHHRYYRKRKGIHIHVN